MSILTEDVATFRTDKLNEMNAAAHESRKQQRTKTGPSDKRVSPTSGKNYVPRETNLNLRLKRKFAEFYPHNE